MSEKPKPNQVATLDFLAAMAQQVTSVFIVTTSNEGKHYGLTATAFASVSVEPPRLLVCVNKSGTSHDMIVKVGHFCVNLLAHNQTQVAKAFAGMLGKDFDRFSGGKWRSLSTGAPVLDGAAAAFDCKLVQTIDQFSHSIFIGEVVAVSSQAQDPLLYGARKFRHLRKDHSDAASKAAEPLDL